MNARQSAEHYETHWLWRYALGLLEEPDCAELEEHCATCDPCAIRAAEQLSIARSARQWGAGMFAPPVGAGLFAAAALATPGGELGRQASERLRELAASASAALATAAKLVWKAPETAAGWALESLQATAGRVVESLAPDVLAVRTRGALRTRGGAGPGMARLKFGLPAGGGIVVSPRGRNLECVIDGYDESAIPVVIFTDLPGAEEPARPTFPEWDESLRRWKATLPISAESGELIIVPLVGGEIQEH